MIGSPLRTNNLRHVIVAAKDGQTGQDIQLHYTHEKIIGNGSFGVVYQAKIVHTGESTAIKRVLQDKRFKVCIFDMDYGVNLLLSLSCFIKMFSI